MCTVRHFKLVSECKWQGDDKKRWLYVKRDNNEYDEWEHDTINLRRKVRECSCTEQQLSENCYDMLGVFKNRCLRTIDKYK